MAASLFHGAPGSYKSASAMWFQILPALREGRLVVTNIEGIKPLASIETELQETFPETAQLWRLSSQNEKGLNLWRNWYHWMPIGALVVIDEVQDVYPTESTFKPEKECLYKSIHEYKDLLPVHWYEYHIEMLESIKPDDFTEADIDDLGELLFDENGHIIYPKTLKECYMRHRKYNWDIICCTPDIGSVHKYIRSILQAAYSHRYFDELGFIPYFFRRPRIFEHNPKLDGKKPAKGDKTNWKKIPVEVHKLYKSTATGSITKGQGKNPFGITAAFFGFILLCYVVYMVMYFTDSEEDIPVPQNTTQIHSENNQANNSFYNRNDDIQISNGDIPVLKLPYDATKMYVSGVVHKKDGAAISRHIIFTLETPDYGELSLNNIDLLEMGYTTKFRGSCNVTIYQGQSEYTAFCNPVRYQPINEINNNDDSSEA